MYILILQRLLLEALLDIFYFPLWWYTKGFKKAIDWAITWIQLANRRLAPGVWLTNIFVPMYGQYDFTGRAISFFMRTVQIVFRGGVLFLFAFGCSVLVAVWLMLPLGLIAGLLTTLFNAV